MIRILFLLFSSLLFAQQKITSQYIDSEITKADNFFKNGKTNECIKANIIILNNSNKIEYSKGIVASCINLATRYFFAGNHPKSLFYLKLAEKERYTQNSISTQITILTLHSYNYMNIGLYKEAINEFEEIITLSDQMTDDKAKIKSKSEAYYNMGLIYRRNNKCDSAALYTDKAIHILQSQKKLNSELKSNLVWFLLESIELKIDEKKIDSAEIDLKLLENRPEKLVGKKIFKLYQVRGLIHCNKKEYDLAIKNYETAIALTKKIQNNFALEYLYKLIIEAHEKKGDKKLTEEYIQKRKFLSDNLRKIRENSTESTVKELVKHKEKKAKSKIQYLMYYICAGILIVIVLLLFITIKIRKERKKIMQKEKETNILSKKLNLAFDEVVQLAKNNDSEFLTRFVEVYPDFFPALQQIEPQMQNSELKFCALLFLNFSSKDIATYTFVQPQSIQTRKNRLRKKLNIPSNEDIYIWMKDINKK